MFGFGEILEKLKIIRIEFEGSSDRAAVIVGTSYLEDLIKGVIQEYLVKGTKKQNKELFDGMGPLSTFSSRIKMAFRLGLISEHENKILDGLRSIRNKFAHNLDASFESQSVKDLVENISIPVELLSPDVIPIPSEEGEDVPLPVISKADKAKPRLIFQETVLHIITLLSIRQLYSSKNRSTKIVDFKTATEPIELVLKFQKEILDEKESFREDLEKLGRELPEDLERSLSVNKLLYKVNEFIMSQVKDAHEKRNYS